MSPSRTAERRRLALGALGLLLVAAGVAVVGLWLAAAARPARPAAAGAARPAARARGLMGRRTVPAGTGMVFLFPADVRDGFWMKDTLVPLSIAFVAADGRVVGTAEMAPCRADPCPSYAPPGAYRYAVELPAGALRAAGVAAGARVRPEQPEALPRAS